jgi:hypothetical protein
MIDIRVREQSATHAEIDLPSGLRIIIRCQNPGNFAARTRARVSLRQSEIEEFVTGVSPDLGGTLARAASAQRKAMLTRVIEAKPVLTLLLEGRADAATWTQCTREGEELTLEADRLLYYRGVPADIWLRKMTASERTADRVDDILAS